jgi:hypothetical protein
MKKAKGEGEAGGEALEVSLPAELEQRLNKALENGEKLSKLDELQASLASIQQRFQRDDEERANAARSKVQNNQSELDNEKIQELMLTDPAAATQLLVKKQMEPTQIALLTLRADNIRNEVFSDAERYPYYTGDLKREIDALLDGQTLAARNDKAVVENAYFATLGRKQREVTEGKLKSRFAASAESARGTASGNTKGGVAEPEKLEITDDIRKLAKMFKTTPEEYAKQLQEEGIGYV